MYRHNIETGEIHNHAQYLCACYEVVGECGCPPDTGQEVILFDTCLHEEPMLVHKIHAPIDVIEPKPRGGKRPGAGRKPGRVKVAIANGEQCDENAKD